MDSLVDGEGRQRNILSNTDIADVEVLVTRTLSRVLSEQLSSPHIYIYIYIYIYVCIYRDDGLMPY